MPIDPVALQATMPAESRPPVDSAAEADAWIGTQLDHFTIERVLGRGGMGAVYLAHDRSLDRQVALKLLPKDVAARPGLQERFLREARAQASLISAHVVQIYYIGRAPEERGGALFFAMEYVEGGTLDDPLTEKRRMSSEEARLAMMQVTRGLKDAHAAGIIHRDIKPSNLLCDRAGAIKLGDFGVAKPLQRGAEKSSTLTHDGMVVGTPLYMAPEQARGEAIDQRADMYSLGCTFFHLVSGRPPFEGPTPLATVARHLTQPVPDLLTEVPTLSPPLAAIIGRLLQKEPAQRFATYEELLVALEAAAPTATEHAGFWVRAAAALMDMALASGLVFLIGWPALIIQLAYVTLAHALRGQTLGKWLLNLEVRRQGGGRLTLARSLVRTLVVLWLPLAGGMFLLITRGHTELGHAVDRMQNTEVQQLRALLTAFIASHLPASILYAAGGVLAALHPEKRGVHDLVVGSEVVYRLRGKKGG